MADVSRRWGAALLQSIDVDDLPFEVLRNVDSSALNKGECEPTPVPVNTLVCPGETGWPAKPGRQSTAPALAAAGTTRIDTVRIVQTNGADTFRLGVSETAYSGVAGTSGPVGLEDWLTACAKKSPASSDNPSVRSAVVRRVDNVVFYYQFLGVRWQAAAIQRIVDAGMRRASAPAD